MNKKTISIGFIGVFVLGVIMYGFFSTYPSPSFFSSCSYTEDPVNIPFSLSKKTFILEEDAYLAVGKSKEYCVPSLREISHELLSVDVVENSAIDKEYFMLNGQVIKALLKGKVFTIDSIVSQKKHGIGSMDSGSGPIDYILLRDEEDVLYILPTPYISFGAGVDDGISLGLYEDGVKVGFLDWFYFKNLLGTK